MRRMRILKRIILTLLVLLPVYSFPGAAQDHEGANVAFTPYSTFGLGQMAQQGTSFNNVKGGVGIADRNVRFINILNPAAITAREKKSFMMDVGMNESNVLYAQGDKRSANNTFNMNHIVMSFPITEGSVGSAFKLGVMPYSNTGYLFTDIEQDNKLTSEIGDIRYTNSGTGGIYQLFLGAGITFFKRFSVGVDGYYYFGNINHATYATYLSTSSTYRGISTGWYYSLTGFGAKFGLQYEQPLGKQRSLILGATYSIPTKLGGEMTRYSYGELSSSTDTIHYNVSLIDGYRIPSELGFGITYRSSDKWMVGFDYRQQDWSATEFNPTPGVDFKPGMSQSFRLGAELTPGRYDIRYYLKTLTYHAGVYYDRSYVTINGHPVAAKGITLGVTFPVFRYYNSITFGVDFGQNGTVGNDMVRERYFKFTLSFSFHDIWFIKQLYE